MTSHHIDTELNKPSHAKDEDEEFERLKNKLRQSTAHISPCQNLSTSHVGKNENKYKKRKNKTENNIGCVGNEITNDVIKNNRKKVENDTDKPEYITDETELIITPHRQKKPQKKKSIELSQEELKLAKSQHKKERRKLQQIESRQKKKKRRIELYKTLSEHAISTVEMELMGKSAELGKKASKKEVLRRLLQKERAGVELTMEERGILYIEVETEGSMQREINVRTKEDDVGVVSFKSSRNKNGNKMAISDVKHEKQTSQNNNDSEEKDIDNNKNHVGSEKELPNQNNTNNPTSSDKINSRVQDLSEKSDGRIQVKSNTEVKSLSFAEQMMAGLSTLKAKSIVQKKEMERTKMEEEAILKEQILKEEEEGKNKTVYKPINPSILKTAATLGVSPINNADEKNSWRVLPITRPEDINSKRYNLPVSTMEYEIIDSVRNHAVTVLCSETGSGKSTQVPQFLYESGITLGNASSQKEDDGLLIGVTQPRRVAAISTAKRVSYEMGHSVDGQTIKGKKGIGSIVAYQTKYENAGLGAETRIKFMTDGILLQEVKSDLLLRKYAVIVLDEAHERNLNTDVLLGLLSAALPLREEAAKEGSLPPLKLIIMSATLRVEDFTKNERLFRNNEPNLVKVPGRTFPVTIHHSKVTELDDYENVAFQKVCQIHRKLPPGAILLFLTGKYEIIRMVNRLRRSLVSMRQHKSEVYDNGVDINDVNVDVKEGDPILRDLDDEEADGDLFEKCIDQTCNEVIDDVDESETYGRDHEDNIPKDVIILPFYSLLSVNEQSRVFSPVEQNNTRLIVVATNIAETSVTIPNISYVVDSGRQKCRNYHAGTGVASYDIMWVSKAAADQRAGRAGRTSPGHCYRLYSSSVYARQFDPFALPEVLIRPLEDVVLAMKAMNIVKILNFPFPTAPKTSQVNAALKLLANIGCIDVSTSSEEDDGVITKLGAMIAKLPLGVRCGKILLISAQTNVLDYGITAVSVLSESNPFLSPNEREREIEKMDDLDDIDRTNIIKQHRVKQKELKTRWMHDGGDILAGMVAAGAYSYSGRGVGGPTIFKRFCKENGLDLVIMQRIQKMRLHLARLARQRLGSAKGVAAQTGKILNSMEPPNKLQENVLKQAIISGFLDNVARLGLGTSLGRFSTDGPLIPRSAYYSCRSSLNEPLFIDQNSVLYSRDPRKLPEWICYDTLIRKTKKDGSTISVMKNITAIDFNCLGAIAIGSELLSLCEPLSVPIPKYNRSADVIMCSVVTKYGDHGWLLPPVQVSIHQAMRNKSKETSALMSDDSYRWFARFLLEGKVFELKGFSSMLNDDPAIITRKKPVSKVALIVSSLSAVNIDSATALVRHWAEVDNKFLFKHLRSWTKKEELPNVKRIWIETVKKMVYEWYRKR